VHDYPNLYPLVRGGALFLTIIGTAIVLGAVWFKLRNRLLAAGAVVATVATALSAVRLSAPYGTPSAAQIAWLVAAVAFEATSLAQVVRRTALHGERSLVLAILIVVGVGVHFLPMAPAFGPLVAVLGALCAINALVALRFSSYQLRVVWAVDGLLKTVFGVVMWLFT
jgi:hypothetical protein